MRTDELGPDLAADIRLIAAWYKISPSEYVKILCRRAVGEVCDMHQGIREAVNNRR
jgi:hypothetical protein